MDDPRNIIVLDENAHVEQHNGITFIARVVKNAPRFYIAAVVATGSGDDIVPGTGHFYEHLPMESTENFHDLELTRYMQARKGYANAATFVKNTTFSAEVAKGYEKDAIFAVSDLVCRPVLVERRFLKEKETILNECAEVEMDFSRETFYAAIKAAYGRHSPARVIGSEESIESMSMEDVSAFYRSNYFADRLLVAIEGDFDPKEMLDEAKQKFVLPRGPREAEAPLIPFESHTEFFPTYHRAVTAAFVFPGWVVSPSTSWGEVAAANLLEMNLLNIDGPLLKRLRFDKQSLYGVKAPPEMSNRDVDYGFAGIAFDSRVKKVVDAVRETPDIIRSYIEAPDESLFQKIKDTEVPQLKTKDERNPERGAVTLAWDALKCGAIFAPGSYVKAFEETTLADIQAYGRRYMSGQNVSLMYRGNIQPDFPTHEDVAKILRADAPTRSTETDTRLQRMLPAPGSKPEA